MKGDLVRIKWGPPCTSPDGNLRKSELSVPGPAPLHSSFTIIFMSFVLFWIEWSYKG